jgi:hypothetical protein
VDTIITAVDGEMKVVVMFSWLQNVGVMKVSQGVLRGVIKKFLEICTS